LSRITALNAPNTSLKGGKMEKEILKKLREAFGQEEELKKNGYGLVGHWDLGEYYITFFFGKKEDMLNEVLKRKIQEMLFN
jgi:hypothetical protein